MDAYTGFVELIFSGENPYPAFWVVGPLLIACCLEGERVYGIFDGGEKVGFTATATRAANGRNVLTFCGDCQNWAVTQQLRSTQLFLQ